MRDMRPMNVGEMRKAIEGLPDDAIIGPEWFNGPPADHEPGVCLQGLARVDDRVVVYVDLFYLGDFDEEVDEDERYEYHEEENDE